MCDPISIGLVAVSAAGTGLSLHQKNKAASRTMEAINAAAQKQKQFSRQAQGDVEDRVNALDPALRKQRFNDEAQRKTDVLRSLLAKGKQAGAQHSGAGFKGNVSNTFHVRKAKSVADNAEMAARLATLMGKATAPGGFLANESTGNSDLASRLATIANFAQGQGGVDRIKINAAGRTNPLIDLLAKTLQVAPSAFGIANPGIFGGAAGAGAASGAGTAGLPASAGLGAFPGPGPFLL